MKQPSTGEQQTEAIILAGGTIREEEFREAVGVDRRPLIGRPAAQVLAAAGANLSQASGSRYRGRTG